jgi:hypothetical protein
MGGVKTCACNRGWRPAPSPDFPTAREALEPVAVAAPAPVPEVEGAGRNRGVLENRAGLGQGLVSPIHHLAAKVSRRKATTRLSESFAASGSQAI